MPRSSTRSGHRELLTSSGGLSPDAARCVPERGAYTKAWVVRPSLEANARAMPGLIASAGISKGALSRTGSGEAASHGQAKSVVALSADPARQVAQPSATCTPATQRKSVVNSLVAPVSRSMRTSRSTPSTVALASAVRSSRKSQVD